jgi:hypothetical protein
MGRAPSLSRNIAHTTINLNGDKWVHFVNLLSNDKKGHVLLLCYFLGWFLLLTISPKMITN